MSEKKIDCRGLACPQPVLKTKELVEKGDVAHVCILVDSLAARENVSRFLDRMGFHVFVDEKDGSFQVKGARREEEGQSCDIMYFADKEAHPKKIVVLVGSDRMGLGDDGLGGKLMLNFVGTLKEMGRDIWRVIFINGGVKLTVEGAETLDALRALEKDGTHILVCGTCLNHFALMEKKRLGETTNMLDIVTVLQLADKVITTP